MNNNEQQHSRNELQHLRNKRQCLKNKHPKLKSIPSPTAPAFATFRNCSPRIVNILWLNLKGDPVTYTKDGLNRRQKMDMNTYEGHPWIFKDYHTGDKLLITTEADTQRREVFFPVPWSENNSQRTQVTILLPGRELPPVMPSKGSKSKWGGLKNIYIMPRMVGGKKRFEAVLAKSRSLPNSASKLKDSHSYIPPHEAPGLIRKSQSDFERSARAMMMHEPRHPILRQATSLGLSDGDAHPSMNGNHTVPTSVIL